MGFGSEENVSLNENITKIRINENLTVFFIFYVVFFIINVFSVD